MLPDAVCAVSGYVVHFNPHLWPRTNQTMTSKLEMMQEKIKKKISEATLENRKHKRLYSAIEIMLVYILLFVSGGHSKEIRTKESVAF